MSDRQPIDVQKFIDDSKLGRMSYLVLAVTTLVMFVDGFDVFVVGRIAPAIASGIGVPVASMSEVFLLQQIGLAVGAFALSPLSDRFGRRALLILTLFGCGGFTVACAMATTVRELALFRGAAGIFMSAAVPAALALLVEMTPQQWRATFLSIAISSYTAGSALSAGVATWLLADYGWQIAFWLGGIAPVICAFLVLLLPESIMFHLARGQRNDAKVGATLAKFHPGSVFEPNQQFQDSTGGSRKTKLRIADVFSDGRALPSVLIWTCLLIHMGTTALLAAWISTFFLEMGGVSLEAFSFLIVISFPAALLGSLIIGFLMDRLGGARILRLFFAGFAASTLALGIIPFSSVVFAAVLLVWHFLKSGCQSGLTAILAQMYPASVRTTGVGWGLGLGRIGGILGPLFGSFALAQQFSLFSTMGAIALAPVAILIILLFMKKPTSENRA